MKRLPPGIAVTTALSLSLSLSLSSWSNAALADPHAPVMDAGRFEVMTPYSPNESGMADWPGQASSRATMYSSGTAAAVIVTPLADNEVGPNELPRQHAERRDGTIARTVALPNPQTPWSPNESGPNAYGEFMRESADHLAAVEQARVAAAESQRAAYLTAAPAEFASTGPTGATSGGAADHGHPGAPADPHTAPLGSDALRREAVTAGVLEAPSTGPAPNAWNVEPLAPHGDLTAGQTVYILPGSGDVAVLMPGQDVRTAPPVGERAAELRSDDTAERPRLF